MSTYTHDIHINTVTEFQRYHLYSTISIYNLWVSSFAGSEECAILAIQTRICMENLEKKKQIYNCLQTLWRVPIWKDGANYSWSKDFERFFFCWVLSKNIEEIYYCFHIIESLGHRSYRIKSVIVPKNQSVLYIRPPIKT